MVVALGPGKFYGSSLPRPRFYTDMKYNTDRVDPPVSVLDPLMSWAEEAHWSMGGLSFQRHRLQGRIEGNVEKLRNQIEKTIIKRETQIPKKFVSKKNKDIERGRERSLSPPPAPMANKRKRRLVDDEDEVRGKWPVRKLSDEFDLVAHKTSPVRSHGVASRTRGQKEEVVVEEVKTVGKGNKRLRKIGELISPSRSSSRLG